MEKDIGITFESVNVDGETLGTKVKIKHLKSSGCIEISYFSDDDLERIVDLVTSKG